MKNNFLFVILLLTIHAQGQTISTKTLNATGGTAINAGISLEWSVGEMAAVQTLSSSSILLTQGVLQPAAVNHSPLPVTLLFFHARAVNKQTILSWATSQEVNSHHFEIERSADGIQFQFLKTVAGAGNSPVLKNYETIDSSPYNGKNFYRLKPVDINGKFSYSITVLAQHINSHQFLLYPNPAKDFITVQINSLNEALTLEIYNASGKLVKKSLIPAATTGERIELNALPSGTYLIHLKSQSQNWAQRFVKF